MRPHEQAVPHASETVRRLVLANGWNATSYQLLNPGFDYWFTHDGDALVAFVRHHGVRVVAGVPVCAHARTAAVAEAFERDAAACGERVAYFAVERRALAAWIPRRPEATAFLIGAQPVWRPDTMVRTLHERPSLRAQLNRAANKGVAVTEWDRARAMNAPELRTCLDQWLDRRGLPALHFLVEPDTLGHLADRHVFVAERSGTVVGFLVASPITARHGWLVEQIVRGDDAPNGTAEALLDAAAEWMARDHAELVTLGLSPLSRNVRAEDDVGTAPPAVRALFPWLRVHGRRFYNFEGLDTFKAKFQPESWEPVYAVVPDRHDTVRAMIAIAAAFGGASAAGFTLRVLSHAVRQELQFMRRRFNGRWRSPTAPS